MNFSLRYLNFNVSVSFAQRQIFVTAPVFDITQFDNMLQKCFNCSYWGSTLLRTRIIKTFTHWKSTCSKSSIETLEQGVKFGQRFGFQKEGGSVFLVDYDSQFKSNLSFLKSIVKNKLWRYYSFTKVCLSLSPPKFSFSSSFKEIKLITQKYQFLGRINCTCFPVCQRA